MTSAYDTILQLEQLKTMDWELLEETIKALAKLRKISFDAHIKAGFTEEQAIKLIIVG